MGGAWRRLVVLPVRDYPDADDDFRAGMDEQVGAVREWWADHDLLGDRAFDPHTPTQIRSRDDVGAFLDGSGVHSARTDDVLVVYVTGHGRRGRDGRDHYLLLPDGDAENYLRDGVLTADLVSRIAASDARHVLVLVNCCFAGTLDDDLRRRLADLPSLRRDLDTVAVVVTADFDERPRLREFGILLTNVSQALRTTAGYTGPELTVEEFLAELTRAAREEGLPRPIKVWPKTHSLTPTACLPNPGYRPRVDRVAPARRQVARADELDYWLARASGRRDGTDVGWYFSGRAGLTATVSAFLEGRGTTLVVTGAAGSGKSAVIARAVTLSDPDVLAQPQYAAAVAAAREAGSLPPSGSVDVAVLARNREPHEILGSLVEGLGGVPEAPAADGDRSDVLRAQLARLVAGRDRPVTVVLDGLDEAVEPTRVVTEVLGPLVARPGESGGVRWLIGVRSPASAADPDSRLTGLLDLTVRATDTPADGVVRTDGPDVVDDLAGYVAALLSTGPGWYARPETAAAAARADLAAVVADAVQPSFLDARFAAVHLDTAQKPQDLADPAWLASLDQGTVGQLRRDLAETARVHHVDVHNVLAVLRASAFALGAGVPWADIWPALARGVLGRPIPDVDRVIELVTTGRLEGYLARTEEDGRVVFAPVHQRLAEVLRDDPGRLGADDD